jgi:hypothetical protein
METKRGFGGGGVLIIILNWGSIGPKEVGGTRGTRAPQFRNSLL